MKIAILLGEQGMAVRFSDAGIIYIFEKRDDVWISEQKFDFLSRSYTSMSDLRSYMNLVVRWLGDCKVFAAKLSNGYYRVLLEGYGIGLWTVEGKPQHFIAQIESFYQMRQNGGVVIEDGELERFIVPIPHKTGFYRTDLRDVMLHKTALNSKEILLPFFKKTPFRQLEIICEHIPRWFQSELSALGLLANIESSDQGFLKIHITKK
ncbi:MAG: hypothetical protein LBC20_07595 [Planctomycetaceae bacterium]|jgi:Fe-only nitrogenase accessory protein AnfO|nr:hypothetical protein [Planctomycetaceae bacterium]